MTFIEAITTIIICIFYLFSCLGAGFWASRVIEQSPLGIYNRTSIHELNIVFLLGSCVLTIIWSALLSTSIFSSFIVTFVLSIFAIIGLQYFRIKSNTILLSYINLYKSLMSDNFPWKCITFFTITIILLSAIICFSPLDPYNDAAAFYMVLPKLMASTNEYSLVSGYESFMSIGLFGELHYAALMIIGSGIGAKVYAWLFGLSTAITIAAITGFMGAGQRGKLISISMVYSSTAFLYIIGDGKTDIFGAALGCAAFYSLTETESDSYIKKYFYAGLFSGFAIIAKISYLPIMFTSILIYIVLRHIIGKNYNYYDLKTNIMHLSKSATWIFLGMIIPFIFHLHKNWIIFEEPFLPFFYFGENIYGNTWAYQSWFTTDIIRKIILTYPLALVFGRYPMQYGNLSVLLLAFLPLLFFLPREKLNINSRLVHLTIASVIGISVWVILRPGIFAPRYMLFALLLIVPIIAFGLENFLKISDKKYFLNIFIIGICIIHVIYFNRFYFHKVKKRFSENEKRSSVEYVFDYLNDIVTDEKRVLTLSYYTYWLKPNILQNLIKSDERIYIFKEEKEDIEEILTRACNRGFKYVLINLVTHQEWLNRISKQKNYEDLKLDLIIKNKEYVLYKMERNL